MKLYIAHMHDTPLGSITIAQQGECLTGLSFGIKWNGEPEDTYLLSMARQQLGAYFAGELRRFALPLEPGGTAFQRRVWQALMDIPYGETAAYSAIARLSGSPGAARAVGSACGANPLPIIIPCHRVVAKSGPGGYAYGLDIKKTLLKLEKSGNNY